MLHKQSSAFTLIEMLIALAIFSVVSLAAGTLLYQAIEAQRVASEYGDRMIDLERGIARLSRDLLQYVPREVRDELGDFTNSLIISPNEIEFTRRGWANPADHARSDLQRVRYFVEGEALQRQYWEILDRAPDTQARTMSLAKNVASVTFEPITESQVLRGDTHVSVAEELEPALGVRIIMQVSGIGEFARVIDLPQEAPVGEGAGDQSPGDDDANDEEELAAPSGEVQPGAIST